MSGEWLDVGEVARRLGLRPRDISDGLYEGKLSRENCVMLSSRWYIHKDYVEEVRRVITGILDMRQASQVVCCPCSTS
jgi:hypothetical protein